MAYTLADGRGLKLTRAPPFVMVHGVHLLGFMDSKVLQECNDILQLQEQMCNKLQEKVKHNSTIDII